MSQKLATTLKLLCFETAASQVDQHVIFSSVDQLQLMPDWLLIEDQIGTQLHAAGTDMSKAPVFFAL